MKDLFNQAIHHHNSKQNVYYKVRQKKLEISSYLNEKFTQIKLLDYYSEGEFNTSEFTSVIEDKLPNDAHHASKDRLIQDVLMVSDMFFNLTQSKKIRVQLEAITTDRCRLFHVDHIKQRLLCTYNGPGTEWLDNSNVNRRALGGGKNFKIVKDFSKVNKADSFDLLLLRGERFNQYCRGAVHRSPPIKSLHTNRVVLKIDEL